jgi:delta8-fatty-acid desaturase
VREVDQKPFHIKVDGKWVFVDEEVLRAHPGASAITTYRNSEASTVFHTFHGGSKWAYKWLAELKEKTDQNVEIKIKKEQQIPGHDDINMSEFHMSKERGNELTKKFDQLRLEVRKRGLMDSDLLFYFRKTLETVFTILAAFYLQYHEYYIVSAIFMGVAWQQLGWLIHEATHHQVFKNRWHNDLYSYFVGDFLQGFSASGWKEQHNVHHAATNVVGRDGDLDLMPFFATVARHLKVADSWLLSILPYQHMYWTLALPFLRLSWLIQSVSFVSSMHASFYNTYRERALYEQVSLFLHWVWVCAQLYFLPDNHTLLVFFLVSQLLGGFLLAHVVTYNHYSVDKYAYDSSILEVYPCLQLYTTRNMKPSMFIDWLWGGLNYQIEHHLFPMMPRHHLSEVMPLVKEWCRENELPYMVDDYFTGWKAVIQQFASVASVADKMNKKVTPLFAKPRSAG